MNPNTPPSIEMQKQMRKTGLKISFMMALMMSFGLSLTGNLTAEHPPEMPMAPIIMGFLASFALSFVVSFGIGLVVPMPKVNAALARKFKLQPRTLKAHIIESIVSNLIYTPLMTTVMVTFVYFCLIDPGHKPPYLPMFISSQIICFIVAQVLIFIFEPFIIKLAMPKGMIPGGPQGGPPTNRP